MSPSSATNAATAREWRELGFFYDTDPAQKAWLFIGSRSGLLQFPRLLREYATNPRRGALSDHDHYGPYSHLTVITGRESFITPNDIRGTQPHIYRLADLIEKRLVPSTAGQSFKIDTEYSSQNEFHLHFDVREDGFDPASADPLLRQSES